MMWKKYVLGAARRLRKQKGSTAINVFGLAVGLTSCLLMALFIRDEFCFDRHIEDAEHIYRVITKRDGGGQSGDWASTSPMMGPMLESSFPEVESSLRVYRMRQDLLFQVEDNLNLESEGIFAEPEIFEFFDLDFKHGSASTALHSPNSLVLTEVLAQKYFGEINPVGEKITIGKEEVLVSGVLEQIPIQFHLDFNFIAPFADLEKRVSSDRMQSWVWQDFYNYIKVASSFDIHAFQPKLENLIIQKAHPHTQQHGFQYQAILQPLLDIHLRSSHLSNDVAVRGNYRYVQALRYIAIFLLVIALINFVNLATAQATQRMKQVRMRKVLGATRLQLILQYLTEAVLVAAAVVFISILATHLLLPELNQFTGKELFLPLFSKPLLLLLALIGIVLLGLTAGIYPAVIISHFPSIAHIATDKSSSNLTVNLRRGLVAFQFMLSMLLIICVGFVYQQLNFLQHTDHGFDQEHLIHVPMKGNMYRDFDEVRFRFDQVPGIESVSVCFGIPGDIIAGDEITVPGGESRTHPARIFNVDHYYIGTMGMKIIAGRDFSFEHPSDENLAFIVNETAVRRLGLAATPEEAVGKALAWPMWEDFDTIKHGQVVGVVQDFHYQSMHDEIETAVMQIYPSSYWKVVMRLKHEDLPATLLAAEKTWATFDTGYPFDYQFVDESFSKMYVAERQLAKLLRIFAMLAIFVACMGSLGLSTVATERRRGEIGIRKVLGASVEGLTMMLVKEFLVIILVAFGLAVPIAWTISQGWLRDFVYRIDLGWWVFVASLGIILGLVMLTVGYQCLRAARSNPIDAIRDQ